MDRKTVDRVAREMLDEHQRAAIDNVVSTCAHVRGGAPVAGAFARVTTTDAPHGPGEPLLARLCAPCLQAVHRLMWDLEK